MATLFSSTSLFAEPIKDRHYLISLTNQVRAYYTDGSGCMPEEDIQAHLVNWLKNTKDENIKSGNKSNDEVDVFIEHKTGDGPGFSLTIQLKDASCNSFNIYAIQY